VTIRWKAHTYADGRPVQAAVKLGASGDVRFLYGQGNDHTGRVAGRDKTIGISRGDGAGYHLCLRNGEGNLQDAHAIQYTPAPPSWNPAALPPVLHLLLGQ